MAMSPPKRRRASTKTLPPEARPPAPALSPDILLEIVARSDAATLFRCAATCKPLRRDILDPAFIRRVCHEPGAIVPPRLLGFLDLYNEGNEAPRPPAAFSLAHPATPAAASFSEKHLAPLLARNAAANLLHGDVPLTSRNGLVLLGRGLDGASRRISMCVFDPLTGTLTALLSAPDIDHGSDEVIHRYVLLTAADGIDIDCSFLVLAAEFTRRSIKVQTVSSDAADGAWGAATKVRNPRRGGSTLEQSSTAVVLGGRIHWLMDEVKSKGMHILTYDVRTAAAGSIELPTGGLPTGAFDRHIGLASSPDGRLSLLAADKLVITVWVLSGGGDGGAGWARRAVIDAEESVRSLVPEMTRTCFPDAVRFANRSWTRSGMVLLQPLANMFSLMLRGEEGLVVLDVETEEMKRVNRKKSDFPYELDLESRLSAMKAF